ncbi:MAG TPA: GGDEF domain-containing protein [Terriglobales bacterium]|jgi:diguanylate cyclase (GGDEF)-like protein|nr:GGDEF domain-containing protein [Terriglobales bacterium]
MVRPTAIWNRDSILELLSREFARATREGSELCVILAGVDRVKSQDGTSPGDLVLGEIAKRLSTLMRPYDHIGRYGNEQLLIVLPSCKPESGLALANKLREAVAQSPIEVSGTGIRATISLAFATSRDFPSQDQEELLRELDKAQYRAEAGGGNRVESLKKVTSAATPTRPRRRRVRVSLVLASVVVAGVVALLFVAPSWICAPFLLGDILDTSELPPPLPANCVPTSEAPSAATLQSLERAREARGLTLRGKLGCKIPSPPGARSSRVRDRQWLDSIYIGGTLQYHRQVLIASAEDTPGGTLVTVELCVMPWWKYIDQSGGRCWEELEFWK